MLADPKFKEWPEENIQKFIELSTEPNPDFPEEVMTEEEARKYISDQTNRSKSIIKSFKKDLTHTLGERRT